MAFNERYYYEYQDSGFSDTYRIELHQDGYSGGASSIPFAARQVDTIRDRGQEPYELNRRIIRGTEVGFNFAVQPAVDLSIFDDIATSEYKEWKIIRKKNGTKVFEGYVKQEHTDRPMLHLDVPYTMKLVGTCGLGDLKGVLFQNSSGDQYDDRVNGLTVIKRCLQAGALPELDFRIQLNTYETSLMTSTEQALDKTTFDCRRFYENKNGRVKPWKCDEVLRHVLKIFHCYICQIDGYWWIVNSREVDSYYHEFDFDTLTAASGGRVVSDLELNVGSFNTYGRDVGRKSWIRPIKRMEVTFQNKNLGDDESTNGDFQLGDTTGWTNDDWDTWTVALNGTDYYLITTHNTTTTTVRSFHADSFNIASYEAGDKLKIDYKVRLEDILFSGGAPPYGAGRPKVYLGVQKDGGTIFYGTKRTLTIADGWWSLTDYFDVTGIGNYTVYVFVDPDAEVTYMKYNWNDFNFNQQRQADEVTFDRVYAFENTAEAFDELEETVKFGDSIQLSDIGALKVGSSLTSTWSREGVSEALPLLSVYAIQLLSDYQQYNTAWEITLHDESDQIRPHSILALTLDSVAVTGEIIKYERNQRDRTVKLTVRELPLTDAGYTSEEIILTTVDGKESGSSEISINVPSYWQQGDNGIYSINKVGIGRVPAGTHELEVDASAGIYASDGNDAVLAMYSGSDKWEIYHEGTSNDLYFDYNGVTKALISQGTLEADSLTRKAYVDAYLGGQALDTSVTSPQSGHDGYSVTWDDTAGEYVLSDVSAGGGGVSNWIDLSDTDPTGYAGSAGYYVRVNSTPDGLEFYDLATYIDGNLGGQTLDSSVTSPTNDGYAITWNDTGGYYELTNVAGVSTWIGLSDTNDANYTGKGGYFVRVDSDPDGLELYDLLGSNVTVTGAWTFTDSSLTLDASAANTTLLIKGDDAYSPGLYIYSGTDYWQMRYAGNNNKLEFLYNGTTLLEIQSDGDLVGAKNITSAPSSGDGYIWTSVAAGFSAFIRLQVATDQWHIEHQASTNDLRFTYNLVERATLTEDGDFNIQSLFLDAPANDDTLTQILARDNVTGEIKYRSATSLGTGGTSYTDENAQDAWALMINVTDTVDWVYDDINNDFYAYVIYQMSITKDFNGLKLVNDEDVPGNSEYYGTNGSGTKGWYALPAGGWPLSGTGTLTGGVTIDGDNVGWVVFQNFAGGFDVIDTYGNGILLESDALIMRSRTYNQMAAVLEDGGFRIDMLTNQSVNFYSTGVINFSDPLSNDDSATQIMALDVSGNLVYRSAASLGGGGSSGWPLGGTGTLTGNVTIEGSDLYSIAFQNLTSWKVYNADHDIDLSITTTSFTIGMGNPFVQQIKFYDTGEIEISYDLPNDNTLSKVLVRDEVSGQIKYRDVSSFSGVSAAGDTNELQMNDGTGVLAAASVFRTSNSILTLGDAAIAGDQRIAVSSSTTDANLILDPQGAGFVDLYGRLRLVLAGGTLIDAAEGARALVYLDEGAPDHLWYSDGNYWRALEDFYDAGSETGAVTSIVLSCRNARNVDKYIASASTTFTVNIGEFSTKTKILIIYKKTTSSNCTLTLDSDTGYYLMFCDPDDGGKSASPSYTLAGDSGDYWKFVITVTPDVVSGYTRALVEYAGPYG